MIMRPGQQLLLPANPLFIWGSVVVALLLNMVNNMGLWGRAAWAPDVLAVVLVFWTVHQPLRVSIGAAFVFGLLMDVHQGGLLGQHAMAYTVLSFLAITVHRRLLWFTVPSQAAQVFPLFVAAHALELLLRLLGGGTFPGWWVLLAPVLEAALWPVASIVLLAPQRRAPDPDANRPL
ncbi:rod shape-determining protein MreD [Rhodoferax sp. TS-BS-61-7]|jgi:rod shape-determining protein MreD|uniref:rod shape-determining protein MreD n=1 Tax=Rhodoferax sp. TS-BS-61-7 TaxID=2094194 RepID=UPI000CF613FF|nr:rod shape-determining protein MreD [Rhodoferax sp. TS-BS-61-7]PQA77107.1 rod shape-determining protein MreD [Rhodoferax sp. TS-BS-61-7]